MWRASTTHHQSATLFWRTVDTITCTRSTTGTRGDAGRGTAYLLVSADKNHFSLGYVPASLPPSLPPSLLCSCQPWSLIGPDRGTDREPETSKSVQGRLPPQYGTPALSGASSSSSSSSFSYFFISAWPFVHKRLGSVLLYFQYFFSYFFFFSILILLSSLFGFGLGGYLIANST